MNKSTKRKLSVVISFILAFSCLSGLAQGGFVHAKESTEQSIIVNSEEALDNQDNTESFRKLSGNVYGYESTLPLNLVLKLWYSRDAYATVPVIDGKYEFESDENVFTVLFDGDPGYCFDENWYLINESSLVFTEDTEQDVYITPIPIENISGIITGVPEDEMEEFPDKYQLHFAMKPEYAEVHYKPSINLYLYFYYDDKDIFYDEYIGEDLIYGDYTLTIEDMDGYAYTSYDISLTEPNAELDLDIDYDDFKKSTGGDDKKEGKFVTEYGNTYYVDADGQKVIGLAAIDDAKYFFKENGSMVKNDFAEIDGVSYYFGSDGKAVTGILQKWGQIYGFDAGGAQYKDKIAEIDGNKYYFKNNGGAVIQDYANVGDKTYYFNAEGHMVTGFLQKWGNEYFFDESGAQVKSDMFESDGDTYYAKENGSILKGDFREFSDGTRYFNVQGKMVKGTTITRWGKKYTFDDNGILQEQNQSKTKTKTNNDKADGKEKAIDNKAKNNKVNNETNDNVKKTEIDLEPIF